jgi:hypothetical protein
MRKLFYIAMALFAAVSINTSCGVNGDDTEVFTTIATVVEGTSSIPYYLVFDDGKEAYVTNTSKWSPSFSETQKELRYIVAYEIINENSTIFDMEVELVQVNPISTQKEGLRFVTATDFTGDTGLQKYTAGATVDVCFLSPARDYITLMILVNGSYTMSSPKMSLVVNTDRENSPYKDLYTEDDGYLYLELYHDNSAYAGSQILTTYWSCKMPDVDLIKSQYNGLKIISMSHSSNRPEVFTFNFTTE